MADSPFTDMAVKTLFGQAESLDGSSREAFLQSVAERDAEAAALLRELLDASGRASGFLETPPWGVVRQAPASVFAPGQVLLGRFEIGGQIGAGGSGEVYRAYDRFRECDVALKTLRGGLFPNAEAWRCLQVELKMASRISHPNICRVYDMNAGAAPGEMFITMELLAGRLLSDLVRERPLEEAQAYEIAAQLVAGLGAAHASGIIHRDFKSSNVMLVEDSVRLKPVIMDFGLAREVRSGGNLHDTLSAGSFAGTPAYMAPEQLQGKAVTAAADIHALGVVLFEMVTGRLPFEGDTPLVVASARLRGEAPRARTIRPHLDRRWNHAIACCLAMDPARRPASAAEVLRLLESPAPYDWTRRSIFGAAAAALAGGAFWILKPRAWQPAAKQAYERGLVFIQRRSAEGLSNAIGEFRQAVRLEPKWPDAWAELAEAYSTAGNFAIMESRDAMSAASAAAQRAVALDRNSAAGQGVLAWTLSLDLERWPKAESHFRMAVRLNPKDSQTHRWFAAYLRKLGKFGEAEREASASIDASQSSDPAAWTELAYAYFSAGDLDRFYRQADEQFRLFPNDPLTQLVRARSLEWRKMFDEALQALEFSQQLGMNPRTVQVQKAAIAASRGDRETALRYAGPIWRTQASNPVDGLLLACVYGAVGEFDRAFEIVDGAYRRHDSTLLSLATSPPAACLRTEPRGREWLARLGFTSQIMQQMEFKSSSRSGSASQPSLTGTS